MCSFNKLYTKLQNKLYKTDKKIEEFEENMYKEWKNIEYLNFFKSQKDYFEYMISLSRFKKLMNLKNKLNIQIDELDLQIKTEHEHYKKYTKFMKYIDIPNLTNDEINYISLKLDEIILPFVLFKNMNRKKFISLSFLINKILLIKEKNKSFHIQENEENEENEEIWKQISEYNDYTY